MKKIVKVVVVALFLMLPVGCSEPAKQEVKIGVSMGVGPAARWPIEMQYMEDKAKELGVDIETRLNKGDSDKTQEQDCKEMIDSGINVLIYTPRNIYETDEVLDYAKEKGVKVISYARLVWENPVDLFVGYDTNLIGQEMGKYTTEKVYSGNYIILKGDKNDFNSDAVYKGMMKYIDPIKSDINIILDEYVNGWDATVAKDMVKEALLANNNEISAILAPNDKLAGAAREALEELNIDKEVVITGMDAEVEGLQRVACNTQTLTIYMDLKSLADVAVENAVKLVQEGKSEANSETENGGKKEVKSYLINGEIVTRENLDSKVEKIKMISLEDVHKYCK